MYFMDGPYSSALSDPFDVVPTEEIIPNAATLTNKLKAKLSLFNIINYIVHWEPYVLKL